MENLDYTKCAIDREEKLHVWNEEPAEVVAKNGAQKNYRGGGTRHIERTSEQARACRRERTRTENDLREQSTSSKMHTIQITDTHNIEEEGVSQNPDQMEERCN